MELVPGALGGVTGWVRYPPPFEAGVPVRPVYRPDRDEWVRMRIVLWPDDGAEHGDDVAAFFATVVALPLRNTRSFTTRTFTTPPLADT